MKPFGMLGNDLAGFPGGYDMLNRHGMRFVERREQAQTLKMAPMRWAGPLPNSRAFRKSGLGWFGKLP